MKCRECEFLKIRNSRYAERYSYYCNHGNQKHIQDYFKQHNIHKDLGFVCFGDLHNGNAPTIKTSPAWCPFKKSPQGGSK